MFDLLFIIPRELKAKKLRTGISILGISTVIMFFVFVLTGIAAMDKFIEASIQSYKGKLVAVEKGKADPPISELPEEYVETIKTIEHVKNVAPILWRFVDNSTNDKTEYLAVRGLEIETVEIVEKNFEIIEGKNLDGTETDEVIIGVDLADLTNKKIGEKIELKGEKFSIKGIFSAEESFIEGEIWMPLDEAQDFFDKKHKISMILVEVTDQKHIDEVADKIEQKLDDVTVFKTEDLETQVDELNQLKGVIIAISLIGLLALILGIQNTMTLTLRERMQDIGIMKSIGISNRSIFGIYILEAIILSLIGGILGIFLCLGAIEFGFKKIYYFSMAMELEISIDIAIEALGISALLGFISGLYPIFRIIKIPALDILRRFG